MAVANLSPAPRPYAPPMAAPGYGKRSTPDQPPRRRDDFAHLPRREAAIAAHIDRLRDGAAIDTKTLARELADYGQQAVRSALAALSRAARGDALVSPFPDGISTRNGPGSVTAKWAPRPPQPPPAAIRTHINRLRAAARTPERSST